MSRKTLFDVATAAASKIFYVSGEQVPYTVFVEGMAAGDTTEMMIGDGLTFENAYDGSQVQFSYQVQNAYTIYGPGHYKINKGSTTGSVGAYGYPS